LWSFFADELYCSAAALLLQAHVIPPNVDTMTVLHYAFVNTQGETLLRGGGLASLLQTFANLLSVGVEELWMALSPTRAKDSAVFRFFSKTFGLLFNIVVNCPLDVLKTRLILDELGPSSLRGPKPPRSPFFSSSTKIIPTYKNIVTGPGGRSTLYSGWQVVVLKASLDYLLQLWDSRFSKLQGSLVQFLPLVSRIFLDYSFMVMKVRANIRNVGIFRLLKKVIKGEEGIYGFLSGWRIYLVLLPFWILNMLLANVMFLLLKKLLYSKLLTDRRDDAQQENYNNNANSDNNDPNSSVDPKGKRRDSFFRVKSATF